MRNALIISAALTLGACASVEPVTCEVERVEVVRWQTAPIAPELIADIGRPSADVGTNGGLHLYALQCDRLLDVHECRDRVLAGEYDTLQDCLDEK